MTGETAEILVDGGVPADDERPLVEALESLGFATSTRVVPTRRGVEWLLLVALPLQAFVTGVGDAFARDACQKLKEGLRRLTGRTNQRPDEPGLPVVVQDVATGLRLVLEPDLPDDAYRQLTPATLAQFTRGPIHFDRGMGRWRSISDEAGAG
jgi:hypothetical protein